CPQVLHVIECWVGDLAEGERLAKVCVDERGHWMELSELCLICLGMHLIELSRGRPEAALAWLERAVERVRPNAPAPGVFTLVEDAAYATLAELGREKEIASLARRLQFVARVQFHKDSHFYLLSYQSRVQRLTEPCELGPDFEALVDEFNGLGQNP